MRSEGCLSRAPHVLQQNHVLHTAQQVGHQSLMEGAGQDLEQMRSAKGKAGKASLLQVGALEVVSAGSQTILQGSNMSCLSSLITVLLHCLRRGKAILQRPMGPGLALR